MCRIGLECEVRGWARFSLAGLSLRLIAMLWIKDFSGFARVFGSYRCRGRVLDLGM